MHPTLLDKRIGMHFQCSILVLLSAMVLSVWCLLNCDWLTALLASAFTLDQMRSTIKGPQDLAKVRVGAMQASTSFEYLQEKGINSRTFSDRKELLAALDDGRLDAVVSDDAVLKYKIKEAQAKGRYESLSVLPFVFEKQNYAFALPDESPHLEELNQALLSARDSPEWSVELVKYIGKE